MHPLTSAVAAPPSSLVDASSLAVPRSNLPLGRKCSIVREEDDLSSLVPCQGHSPPTRAAVFSEETEEAAEEASERAVRPALSLPATAPHGENCSQHQSPAARLRCVPGRRLHAVKSSPQLLAGTVGDPRRPGVAKLRMHVAGRNRTTSCSSSDDDGDGDKRRAPPLPSAKEGDLQASPTMPGLATGHDEGYSADSTDSLDILPDPSPRLTNSVSCGDLTMESPAARDVVPVQCADVVLVEDAVPAETTRISNSFSLAAGLSCLGRRSSREEVRSSKPRLGCSLAKLVPNGSRSGTSSSGGALKSQLDINQNGFRKGRTKNQSGVVDVKMASKCCTLC